MIQSKRKYYVTGAKAIAAELGCSQITVLRRIARKRLKAWRTGANSSPCIEVRGCSFVRTPKDGLTIAGPRLEGDNPPADRVRRRQAATCHSENRPCTIDIVETFRLLTLASDPDFVVLRLVTRDGKVHNFGVDRAGFTHVVSVWNFDLSAMAGAIKSGARAAAAQQKAS